VRQTRCGGAVAQVRQEGRKAEKREDQQGVKVRGERVVSDVKDGERRGT
jgi:hypothetical protein